MTPDDVRMTAQLVVDKRVHCVSDEAVEAMARRVLELEGERDDWKAACLRAREVEEALTGVGPLADVAGEVAKEREACAELTESYGWNENDPDPARQWRRDGTVDLTCRALGSAIRARGAK